MMLESQVITQRLANGALISPGKWLNATGKGFHVYMETIISRVSEKQRNASGRGAQARGEDQCQPSVLGSQRRELRSEPPGRDRPPEGRWEQHHPLSEPDRSPEFRAVLSP